MARQRVLTLQEELAMHERYELGRKHCVKRLLADFGLCRRTFNHYVARWRKAKTA